MSFDIGVLKTIAIFALISFIPILGWIYFFQSQNYEKKKYVIITFIAGMFSIIPIKVYEKYWDFSVWEIEHLNMFEHIGYLANHPTLLKLIAFLIVSVMVALFMFIFSAIIMFFLEIFSRDNTVSLFAGKTKKISESPMLFVTLGGLFGLCAAFLSLYFPEKVWFFVIVGMLEEFGKYLMLRFADEDKIGSVSDAISFSIIIALGFAFVENVIYISKFWANTDRSISTFTVFFILRSTISTIAHVCFSAITGYFYGIAHFSDQIYLEESREKKHPILGMMHKLFHLKGAPLFHEEKLLEGLLLSMIVHAAFNSLLEFEMVSLVIPFLIGTFIYVLNLLHRRDNHIRRGHTTCNVS